MYRQSKIEEELQKKKKKKSVVSNKKLNEKKIENRFCLTIGS